MICPTCNKEIEDGVLVCEYCGQEFVYEEYEEEAAEEAAEGVAEGVAEEAVEETAEETAVESVENDVEEVEVAKKSYKRFKITAFILALCGIATMLTPVGFVLSILALIFNRVYKKKSGETSKMVKATKVLGIIVLIISTIASAVIIIGGGTFTVNNWRDFERFGKRFVRWVEDFFKLFRVFR